MGLGEDWQDAPPRGLHRVAAAPGFYKVYYITDLYYQKENTVLCLGSVLVTRPPRRRHQRILTNQKSAAYAAGLPTGFYKRSEKGKQTIKCEITIEYGVSTLIFLRIQPNKSTR